MFAVEEFPDLDRPLTLKHACELVFGNAISPASLMAEHRRGNLRLEKIGRRYFVTLAGIKEMRHRCQVDPTEKAHGFGFSQNARMPTEASNDRGGSSAMAPSSAARGALQMTLQALRGRSPNT